MRLTWCLRPSWIDELDTRRGQPAGAGRRGRAVVELDPVLELRERLVRRLALDLGLVDLLDLVARVREPVRELAVVREQEDAGRVCVEAPDRDDARLVLDELDDGRPPLRVARGRHDPGGLVEEDVGDALREEEPPVEVDDSRLPSRTCSARR